MLGRLAPHLPESRRRSRVPQDDFFEGQREPVLFSVQEAQTVLESHLT